MINKFYKVINNKYLKLFKFIFFLRYLFTVFFISTAIFLIIPIFFDYEKRSEVIKKHISKNYNLKLNDHKKITFNLFPTPNLEVKDAFLTPGKISTQLFVENLRIFPRLFSIYNFDNFETKKIVFKNNNASIELKDLKLFFKDFYSQKKKFFFDDLSLLIVENNKKILEIKNIRFSNYGYKSDYILGKIFEKKFKIKFKENLKNLQFKLIKSGIQADIYLNEKLNPGLLTGLLKAKILNTNLKLNFEYDGKALNIKNLYLRNKLLSFRNSSFVELDPFLEIETKFDLEEFDNKIFKKLDLTKVIKSKNILKKINSKNEINFKPKKFNRNFLDELNLGINFAYGRMNYFKKITFSTNKFNCEGNINLLEDYPLLFFNCSIFSEDKYKFYKVFSINSKSRNEILKIDIKGNLGIINKKINFKNISTSNYTASKEDLKYFKETFESILFDESFFEIFDLKKIKKFILEIS